MTSGLKNALQLSLRVAVAAGLSLGLAQLVGAHYPIYAMIAAVIVTDLDPAQSRALGLRRLGATIVGAACGAGLTELLPLNPWTVALGILLSMLVCSILRARDAAKIAAYICEIVLIDHSAEPWWYAFHRFVETALGIVVALAISYMPKLIREDHAQKEDV